MLMINKKYYKMKVIFLKLICTIITWETNNTLLYYPENKFLQDLAFISCMLLVRNLCVVTYKTVK